ncbi:carbohydrate kinase family protein [Acidisoma cellulosilytica]|uniref:Carbohydrate kinase family protein n=1 Tax=Acidisoma cellulosilyticum TaxID=2802395 RepID=A0A963Z636_9PROT|nr:carbohydrate kinase family protein [Acidisoma cellulosilyticum]MCB8883522.1 carbohydrate kinase family protein [Acidisoma cellulosilyticum]
MPTASMSVAQFLTVGDLDVDVLIAVDQLPTQDGKVNGRLIQRVPGGMAANVAVAIAQLGGIVAIAGRVGEDAEASFVLDQLKARGVDTRHVKPLPGANTFSCISLIAADGEKSLIKLMTDAYCPTAEDLTPDIFLGVTHAHLTSARDPDLCRRVVALAKAAGASCSLDVESADLPRIAADALAALQGFDILLFNRASRKAAATLLGTNLPTLAPVIITTMGLDGAAATCPDGQHHAPGFQVPVSDTTGAGDCFAGALLHARIAQQRDWPDALRFANAAAALSVQGLGAQTALPSLDAVEALLARHGKPLL